MRQIKRQFVEEYIKRVEQAVKAFNEANPASADQAQNDLFDLLVEIRNVFDSDMPNIDSAIFLRNGTAIRDANSVLGILKFYLINNEDAQADQSVPLPQTTTGDKIFISHRSVDSIPQALRPEVGCWKRSATVCFNVTNPTIDLRGYSKVSP